MTGGPVAIDVVDEASGVRVRVLEDGTLEEVGEIPRRWSVAANPAATRRAR